MTVAINEFQGDGFTFTGATAAVGPYHVLGGKYLFFISAAGTSSSLQMIMPDGSTAQAVSTATTQTTSAAVAPIDLCPGLYQIAITTVSAVQGGLVRIPYRAA